jgi:hypothetical protein
MPAMQAPLWQVSLPLHTLASGQGVPFRTGALEQPKMASQASVVHALPSLQSSAVPAVQDPPWQVSLPLQTLPSLHAVPLGTAVFVHPESGLQASTVQTLPSLQLSAVPAVQVPLWQVSSPLQKLPSRHGVPLATGVAVQPKMASQALAVHGLPSLQSRAVPPAQVPL